MLKLKEWIAKVSEQLSSINSIETYTVSWGGTTVSLKKRGVTVLGVIWNPRTVAAGWNAICTLPIGWRPVNDVVWLAHSPHNASTNVADLRYNISPSGEFRVYNYGSAWTNADSNISLSFTYVCANGAEISPSAMPAIEDFVVDYGSASGSGANTVAPWSWTYRKWNSGIAECWATVPIVSNTYAANGGNRSFNYNYPSGLFISVPSSLQVSGNIAGVVGTDIGFTANNSKDQGQSYLINRNAGSVTATGNAYIHVTGLWKSLGT